MLGTVGAHVGISGAKCPLEGESQVFFRSVLIEELLDLRNPCEDVEGFVQE
jgi:hypothetical protein